jgi:hypothetical protein
MHRELINLTAKQIVGLAEVISRGEHKRITKNRMRSLLAGALKSGTLAAERVKDTLKADLQG